VLLIKRGWPPFEGQWALPGGYVDAGEETFVAAARELLEETGVKASILDLVGVYAEPGRDPRGRYVTFAYTERPPYAVLPVPKAGDDAAEAEWVPLFGPDGLASDPSQLAFDHWSIIVDAISLPPEE
jgi:8-oxo-dGTP diphosphatase